MKKNITCLILSLLFTFTFLGQNSQEKRHSIIHQINNREFNKINKSENISHYRANIRQSQFKKYRDDKKKKLDSIISIGADGYDHGSTFMYNNNGYLTIETKFDRENSNQWDVYRKGEYEYDNQGNITSIVDSEWNKYTNQWYFSEKEELLYNHDGNVTSIVNYDWNTSQWNESSKNEYTYNAQGNLTEKLNYYWNQNDNQWEYSSKIEYSYDSQGNFTSMVYYDWNSNSNQWEYDFKEEYSYDTEGNIILLIVYHWYNNQWENYFKEEYNYDVNYNNSELILPYWFTYWFDDDIESKIKNMMTNSIDYDYKNQNWVEGGKDTLYYSDVSTSNIICENLSITNGTYPETDDLNQKAKDEFGDSYVIADWNDLKNMTNLDDWISCMNLKHDDTFFTTRDGNYIYSSNRQYFVHYSTDGVPYSGFAVHDQVGDFYLGSWYGISMNILAKNNGALAIEDFDQDYSLKIFPNPMSNYLTIDSKFPIKKVELYSLLGKKVKEINSDFNSIHLSNLKNGIYLVRIESENGFAVKKLIKQ